jgi:hypothetical protein
MKNLIIYGLVFFLLALNCMAVSPVQLTGSSGKAVLNSIGANNSNNQEAETLAGNTSNLTNNSSLDNLWSWGSIPEGYSLNKFGKLVRNSTETEWLPSI